MIEEEALTELTHEVMSQGIDEKTAWHYAALIGDTPLVHNGKVIIRDGVREIATLEPLEYFDMK